MNHGLNDPPKSGMLNFFFKPVDPSTLGFMRIMTGLLVLYVLFAYSFDLTAFFGPKGWIPVEQPLRERKERPYAASPLDGWETEFLPSLRLPHAQHRREVIIKYLKNLPDEKQQRLRATAYYFQLPNEGEYAITLPGQSQRRMRRELEFIEEMKWDASGRGKQLDKIRDSRLVSPDPDLPRSLQTLPEDPALREAVIQDVIDFVDWLPGGSRWPTERGEDPTLKEDQRRYVLNFLEENLATREQMKKYLNALPEDRETRHAAIDYLDEWDVDPNQTFAKGMPTWSIWFHITDPTAMKITHVVIIGIVIMFTCGLFTRVTSVLAWLAVLSYTHRTTQVLFGLDVMMNIAMIYLMIAPCGAALSFDRLIQRYRIIRASYRRSGTIDELASRALEGPAKSMLAGLVTRLFQIHFCFIYMSAGLSKLKGETWWSHHAMWLTISNPEFSPINVNWYESVLHAMAENRMLHAIAMTSGVVFTLIMEIGLPFLVWTRLRPYMVMGSAALHAGVGMFMGLTVFSLFMMVLVFCYIRPEAVRERTAGWPGLARLRLRFRSDNPRQLRSASLVRAVDVNAQVELIDTADESEDKRTTSIEVLGPEGQKATGISAFGLLLQKLRLGRKVLPLFWPFLALAGAFRSSSEQPPKPTSGKVVATR